MAGSQRPDLIAIVGPTASGKSELAMKIALRYGGEIIAADSRTIYKDLDIGTAKPSAEEQKLVPHWGIDLIEPGRRFTAADYQAYSKAKIKDIIGRRRLAILVGGTGLYIDSVLYDFEFGPDADLPKRSELEGLTINELQKLVEESGLQMPTNSLNRRHLIRTLERQGAPVARQSRLRPRTMIVGLIPPDEELKERIAARAQRMFAGGLLEEAVRLKKKYPGVEPADMGIVYKLCSQVLAGQFGTEEAIERFQTLDWQYVRRQKTWFKRNPEIKWFADAKQASRFIESSLNT